MGTINSSQFEYPAGQAEFDSGTNENKYNGTGFAGAARYNVAAASADHKITGGVRNAASVAGEETVVDFDVRRNAATGAPTSCYRIRIINTNGTVDTILYYKVVASVESFVDADSCSVPSLGGNGTLYNFAVDVTGSTITVFCNGVSIGSTTDSSVTTGLYTGHRIQQQTTANAIRITDWSFPAAAGKSPPFATRRHRPNLMRRAA